MELVEIARFYDPEEAFIACGMLNAAGLPAYLNGQNHLSVEPHLRIAFGGSRLCVCTEDEKIAAAMLEDVLETPIECNACGAKLNTWRASWLSAVFAIFVVIPFIHRQPTNQCSSCGATFEPTFSVRTATNLALILIGGCAALLILGLFLTGYGPVNDMAHPFWWYGS